MSSTNDISKLDAKNLNLLSVVNVPYNGSVYDFGIRLKDYLRYTHNRVVTDTFVW